MKRFNGLMIGIGAGLVGLAGVAGGLALAYKKSKKHNDAIKAKLAQKATCECCGCDADNCDCDCCDHENAKDLFEEEAISDVSVAVNDLDDLSEEDLDTLLAGEDLEKEEDLETVKFERDYYKKLYEESLKETK